MTYTRISQLRNPELLRSMSKQDKLMFAKVGVFNPLELSTSLRSILTNKIKDGYFWEYQETQLSGKIVNPQHIVSITKGTGTKSKKIKLRRYFITENRINYTYHSLERFFERSGKRGLGAGDFFTNNSNDWIDNLASFQKTKIGGVSTHKLNWLLPFGNGAFVGSVSAREGTDWDIYEVLYTNNQPAQWKIVNSNSLKLQTYFYAQTFIHHSQMREDQKKICKLILEKKYTDAFELNYEIIGKYKVFLQLPAE